MPKRTLKRRGQCAVCSHPQVHEINAKLLAEEHMRDVAAEYAISKSTVHRHKSGCFAKAVESYRANVQENQGINVEREFKENLEFAKRLRTAAEEYLEHPTDPLKLAIIPRADEIDVVYFDYADIGKHGPKKKTAKLSVLLATLSDETDFKPDRVTIKHVDMRKFALDAIETTDICIDKFAKLAGAYRDKQPNPFSIENALKTYQIWLDKNPLATSAEKLAAIDDVANFTRVDRAVLAVKIQQIDSIQ